jgi:tRNA(Arg) A34 adenosine deaminase TadA
MRLHTSVHRADLPPWCTPDILQRLLRREVDWLAFAIALAERNVARGTGGPFGAIIVDDASGEALGVGVNRVESLNNPVLHAEVVAIASAAATLRAYAIGAVIPRATLYTSSEPCVMCLGAVHWAGLHRVVYAAPVAAAERIGFDEGPNQRELRAGLAARGIRFVRAAGVRRVTRLLAHYVALGRDIYNADEEGTTSGRGRERV